MCLTLSLRFFFFFVPSLLGISGPMRMCVLVLNLRYKQKPPTYTKWTNRLYSSVLMVIHRQNCEKLRNERRNGRNERKQHHTAHFYTRSETEKRTESQLLGIWTKMATAAPAKPYLNQKKAESIFGGHLHYCFLIPNMYSRILFPPFVRLCAVVVVAVETIYSAFFRASIFLPFFSISSLLFSDHFFFLRGCQYDCMHPTRHSTRIFHFTFQEQSDNTCTHRMSVGYAATLPL